MYVCMYGCMYVCMYVWVCIWQCNVMLCFVCLQYVKLFIYIYIYKLPPLKKDDTCHVLFVFATFYASFGILCQINKWCYWLWRPGRCTEWRPRLEPRRSSVAKTRQRAARCARGVRVPDTPCMSSALLLLVRHLFQGSMQAHIPYVEWLGVDLV